MNKHVIQLSLTFVSLFMHLPIYFLYMCYIIHLYMVLVDCTQVHFQCTWVVPSTFRKTLYLYLNIFNVLVLVPKYR